jgi:predicted aspartyl protease
MLRRKVKWQYSHDYSPPAPVVVITLAARAKAKALVDTGADVTVISKAKADESGISKQPPVSLIFMRSHDYTGLAPVFEATLQLGHKKIEITPVIATIGDEAILGRDVLNKFVIVLDGPNERINLS